MPCFKVSHSASSVSWWLNEFNGGSLARSSIRILIVEDFEPFRRVVASMLQQQPELQIISESSDGLEAVRQAEELQPDLILLDIGLPNLNGVEAARRIQRVCPGSRILFVTQESSVDIVQEALRLGAQGYVVKSDAGTDLLTAVNTVLLGKTFVSRSLAGYDFTGAPHVHVPESTRRSRVPAPVSLESAQCHEAVFYSDDSCLLDAVTRFVGTALKVGNAAIVLATESHRDRLLSRLQTYGLDIGTAVVEGRYMALDAADTLSTFIVDGMPDPVRFVKAFGDLIVAVAKATNREHSRVAVFGECVHLLWAQGNAEAAIQMEKLGNQLTQSYNVDILCGYPLSSFRQGHGSRIFERICAEHSLVYSR